LKTLTVSNPLQFYKSKPEFARCVIGWERYRRGWAASKSRTGLTTTFFSTRISRI
jgi:hypothetical protein